jgi:DNA polymerase-4
MFFVGKQTAKLLIDNGVKTIGDLAKLKPNKAAELLNKNYESYLYMANGGGDDELDLEYHSPKSIGVQNTFLLDTDDFEEIKDMMVQQCKEIIERAISQDVVGKTVNVTIKYPDFSTKQKSYTLDHFINSIEELLVNAVNLYEKMNKSEKIRLIGVSMSNLVPNVEELNIFNYDKQLVKKDEAIKDIINEVNEKMKKNMVGTAKSILS